MFVESWRADFSLKTYTWTAGGVDAGIETKNDERFGAVVFLGEDGRGRRFERVAMSHHRPADVDPVEGEILEATPEKIVLPASNGRPEKIFFVLARPSRPSVDVLVRVNTYTGYVRGGNGCWRTVAGEPTTVVSGYGAFGDAGRIGNWSDGLIVLHPGDVLKVCPSCTRGGYTSWALWLEGGVPKTLPFERYERELALAGARAEMAKAQNGEASLRTAFGRMPAMTYIVGNGDVESGIKLVAGDTAISFGQKGRGRIATEVPFVGFTAGERLEEAGVVILSEKEKKVSSYEAPEVERLYGLVESQVVEEVGAILLRIVGNRTPRRGCVDTQKLRGEPTQLARGVFASGDAGYAGSSDDTLWVLRSGESVVIRSSGENSRVLENQNGVLQTPSWYDWKVADGQANPSAYIPKGRAPWGHVPTEWIGRVVAVDYRGDSSIEGELVEVHKGSISLNLGWDGRDRKVVAFETGVWVTLHADKKVAAPDLERLVAEKKVREDARLAGEMAEQEAVANTRAAAGWLVDVLNQHQVFCPRCGARSAWMVDTAVDLQRNGNCHFSCVDCGHWGGKPENQRFHQSTIARLEGEQAGETVPYDGRDAVVLRRTRKGTAVVLTAVAYKKYGGWNFVLLLDSASAKSEGEWNSEQVWLRSAPARTAPVAPTVTTAPAAPAAPAEKPSAAALDALRAQFGFKRR